MEQSGQRDSFADSIIEKYKDVVMPSSGEKTLTEEDKANMTHKYFMLAMAEVVIPILQEMWPELMRAKMMTDHNIKYDLALETPYHTFISRIYDGITKLSTAQNDTHEN